MPPNQSYLLLNNLRFHYLDWGGEGRLIVLLHGLASNARIWDFVAPRLVEAGYHAVALDQRSHGLTDPADEGFDFHGITRDLHAFIETLNRERPLLVGHSWGAGTVLNYAVLRPSIPAGVVLVDGGFTQLNAAPDMTWDKAEQMLRPPDLDGMPVEEFRQRLRGWMDGWYSEAAAEIVLANFRMDEDDRLYRRLPIPQHMRIARAIYEQNTFDLYARLRCPALLCPAIDAPRDERAEQFINLKRAGVARAEQASPLVRALWFENTVHDIPLHRPNELAQAIAEFERHLPSAR
jgi:pimeloyl-ACP methyl ester carboxylesterase